MQKFNPLNFRTGGSTISKRATLESDASKKRNRPQSNFRSRPSNSQAKKEPRKAVEVPDITTSVKIPTSEEKIDDETPTHFEQLKQQPFEIKIQTSNKKTRDNTRLGSAKGTNHVGMVSSGCLYGHFPATMEGSNVHSGFGSTSAQSQQNFFPSAFSTNNGRNN